MRQLLYCTFCESVYLYPTLLGLRVGDACPSLLSAMFDDSWWFDKNFYCNMPLQKATHAEYNKAFGYCK